MNERCVSCHGGVRQRADLSLVFREDAIRGGESGNPAVVPGSPGSSELIRLVAHSDPSERMPKDAEPLSSEEVALLRTWISDGAAWTPHWAYVPPTRPLEPETQNPEWVRSGIDAFVLARLEAAAISPTESARCRVLGRRVSLDLVGLPPSAEELDELCKSAMSDEAYATFVDGLLAQTAFGERWATMWLDLARYADSKGYEADRHRSIWRYRDWVIDAFNQGMAFDQFSIEQLAGDLLPDPTKEQLIATAFHRNAMTNEEGGTDDEEHRVAAVVDRVNTTWEVWQGTTMSCAQCHGHPYDPFRQTDYYRSFALFNNTADWDQPNEEPVLREFSSDDEDQGDDLLEELREIDDAIVARVTAPDVVALRRTWEANMDDPTVSGQLTTTVQNEVRRIAAIPPADRTPHQESFIRDRFAEVHASTQDLRDRRRAILNQLASIETVHTPILQELPPDRARTTRLLERGSFLTPSEAVEPGVPNLFHESDGRISDRRAFAEWLFSAENPLTARVTVNRFWEQIFGVGLVATLEDFGTQGEPPSHPDLLDWLAVRFADDLDWDVKALLREMVSSSTYRQSSRRTDDRDPNNRLLSRGPRVRATGEQLRDQALAVSGLLSKTMRGPSVMPPQPDGIWNNPYNGARWTVSEGSDRHRRAVYTYWRRTAPYPSMVTFDSPSREFCVSRRVPTNTPLQALVTLNDPVYWEAAQALGRAMLQQGGTDSERLEAGYRRALGRQPSAQKLSVLKGLVEDSRQEGASQEEAFSLAANVIMNLDEFITRE